MAKEVEFDCKAVTRTMCASPDTGRACLGIRIVDETGELTERRFECKIYHCRLERKDTLFYGRRAAICKRCEQCRKEHPSGHQPDFDEPLLKKYFR